MKLNKLFFCWVSVLVLVVPGTVMAANELTFSEDTTIQVSTTDTVSSETVTAVSGSNLTSLDVGSNYIDLSLDSGSDVTLTNDGSIYFVVAVQSGSGSSYPSCPSSSNSLNITATATTVVRVTVVATDPACESSPSSPSSSSGGSGSARGGSFNSGGDSESSTSTSGSGDTVGVFDDIEGHWAESYIEGLKELEVIEGRSDKEFAPNDYINRAEALKIALLLFDFDIEVDLENTFSDVSLADWYFSYVVAGKFYDLVEGFEDGSFGPGLNITRASALKILMIAAGVDLDESDIPFSDVEGHWAGAYIAKAYGLGVVEGYGDESFKPDNSITRAEFSKIAYTLYNLIK